MAIKSLKKTLVYTSERNKELIESMLKDASTCTSKPQSEIMEGYILNGLLTEDKEINILIKSLYVNGTSEPKDIVTYIFEHQIKNLFADQLNFDIQPLIEYVLIEQIYCGKTQLNTSFISELIKHLRMIKEKIEEISKNFIDSEEEEKYLHITKTLNFLIEVAASDEFNLQIMNYYRFFKNYWNEVKELRASYEVLSDLVLIQNGWRNTPESRYGLVCCLRDLANNWKS